MKHILQRARSLRKNMTEAEKKLWSELRCNRFDGLRFRRQVPFGFYIVDFVCFDKKLIIELDGSQHGDTDAMIYDQNRTKYLELFGYQVLRFWNHEVCYQKEWVREIIWHACFPSLPSQGEGSLSSIAK